ncbi:MAG: PIN domain-containing protein, partial [Candidatus Hodarchaeales archaeon]
MSIFIDTGIWIGFFNASDEMAERSAEIIEEIQRGKFGVACTSLFVVNELFTFLERRTRNIQLAIDAAAVVLGKKEEFKPFVKLH